MRLLAIGDIHGCATSLDVLITAIQLQPGDRLITLGDYLNKGKDTKAVIEHLIELYQQRYLIPLKGNHELKLIHAIEHGKTCLGAKTLVDESTLNSYQTTPEGGTLADIPAHHLAFVRDCCLDWYETKTHLFAHATVDPERAMHEQSHKALFWDKLVSPQPHQSGKTLVCGHTPQRAGVPLNLGHVICLDTAASEGHWLTCLDVNSGEIWQANEQGVLRQAWMPMQHHQWHSTDVALEQALITNALTP